MHTALEGVSFDACAGTFLSVVGPSGCGKSTLLHIAAGLLQPTRGSVFVFGQRLDGVNHRASYMFQQDALLPWKNVRENVALGLTFRGRSAAESNQLAAEWIRRVGLDGFGDSYPAQLSGGMRKRVAMAQSWIVDPDIVLMDEPFAALDVHTRLRMENEILDLWAGSGKTVLFITHDLEEAIGLSDEVAVLSVGPGSRIIARHKVDLARPRNLLDIRTESRFQELYKTIWSGLRQEVLRSYERD
ncbi:MAG: ABC transporter ATP-binding protein [Acidobacteriia bacterium]|nr:ABC transporter ATP-binding protein [Terriglobia bacterium]